MGWGKTLRAACAGLAAGAFISSAMPTLGFDSGGAEPGSATGQGEMPLADGSLAGLQAQIATLTSRLEKLEETTKGPMTVKGPFVVTDEGGKPVFTAKAQGAGGLISIIGSGADATLSADSIAELSLKDSKSSSILTTRDGSSLNLDSGSQHLFAGSKDGETQLALYKGQTSVDLVAREGSPLIAVNSGAKSVTLDASSARTGLAVKNGENLLAQLGDPGNGNTSLGIFEKGGGKAAVVVGYHANGVPGLSVWEGSNALANIGKDKDGSGGKVTIFDDGKEVIKLGTAENKTGLHINRDNDVVFAGKGADGPEFSLQQGADKLFNVAIPGGNAK